MAKSSAYKLFVTSLARVLTMSLISIANSLLLKTLPLCMPSLISNVSDKTLSIFALKFLPLKFFFKK